MRKLFAWVLTLTAIFSSMSFSFYAAKTENPAASKARDQGVLDSVNSWQANAQTIDQSFYNQIPFSGHNDIYDAKCVQIQYITIGGNAGEQPKGGTRFPSGGGFFWSDEGGPKVRASVSFSEHSPKVKVSANLGVVGNVGKVSSLTKVPNTKDFFQLYVSKTIKVQQINIYRTNRKIGKTTLWLTMYSSTPDSCDLSAHKVLS